MKKKYISKIKNVTRVSLFLQISLMAGLIEDSRILISASAFYLGPYVVLIEQYEENLAPHRYVFGKKGNILIAFSDNCGCSLILYQNFANGSSFLFRCNVESSQYQ